MVEELNLISTVSIILSAQFLTVNKQFLLCSDVYL